jgi:endonuclease/exonuclease/phosphatase family metal-dependent hydrolase
MNNPNIWTTPVTSYQKSFKFMTYNVDQAVREEQFPSTKWEVRRDRIAKLIDEVDADIVCLQEMRELENSMSVKDFLHQFKQYQYVLKYRNPSKLSFGLAILYKPEKFFAMDTLVRWLSDTPDIPSDNWSPNNGFGSNVLCQKFIPVVDQKCVFGSRPLWILNTHFGLDEELKTKSCQKLVEIIRDVIDGCPFVLSGDFNFFPDRDGPKQRSIITEHFVDAGQGAITLNGKQIEGTFIGYDHDNFKADLNNINSRLDNIFVSGVTHGRAILYTKTMMDVEPPELTTRDFPSDHLPIVIDINFE